MSSLVVVGAEQCVVELEDVAADQLC